MDCIAEELSLIMTKGHGGERGGGGWEVQEFFFIDTCRVLKIDKQGILRFLARMW